MCPQYASAACAGGNGLAEADLHASGHQTWWRGRALIHECGRHFRAPILYDLRESAMTEALWPPRSPVGAGFPDTMASWENLSVMPRGRTSAREESLQRRCRACSFVLVRCSGNTVGPECPETQEGSEREMEKFCRAHKEIGMVLPACNGYMHFTMAGEICVIRIAHIDCREVV
jgi:hypothetical protein